MKTSVKPKNSAPKQKENPKLARAALFEYGLVALSLVWLALVGLEFVFGERDDLSTALYAIWAVFVADFLIRVFAASDKVGYLRSNSLTAISLLLPALRVFRLIKILRIARSAQLIRALGSFNRAFGSLGRTLGQRGLPYVALLTTIITLLGAAAFYRLESPPNGSIQSYSDAIWFAAMIMTTMGSSYWPHSGEGRILCFAMSLYAFGVFGYVTAALASFFIGQRDAGANELHRELGEIKDELRRLNERLQK